MYPQVYILIFLHIIEINTFFIEPDEISDIEAHFVKNGIEYTVFDMKVTWFEAEVLCESQDQGSLANVDFEKTSIFLSEALSETNMELESLWVGARRQSNFTWINSGNILADKFLATRGKSFKNIERNCLSFQRKYHDRPNFIDLECRLKRPFICEKAYTKVADGSLTTPEWIKIGNYLYGIFYDQKTWKQSVRECRSKHGAHLASFRNYEEVKLLGKFLLIGRPSLGNAWIGGYFMNNTWKFVSRGGVILETRNPKSSFPPWRRDKPRKHSGCLLLDRHIILNYAIFLEARCERKRSYICSKEIKSPSFSVFVNDGTGYIMYYIRKNWDDAFQTCNDMDAKLIRVSLENIHYVTYMMGENATEVRHIWISGRLSKNGTHFYWVYENETLPLNNEGYEYFPPWYDNDFDQNFACLNMDRENHNVPIFYGVACDTPQAFICEQNDLAKLPKG